MKKQLFDLTIEEFTRVLLDYPEDIHLEMNVYENDCRIIDENTGEPDGIVGSYTILQNLAKDYPPHHPLRMAIEDVLKDIFDYDIRINKLDIYNYLEHITCQFQEERVRVVLYEMDFFYQMIYLETIDQEVQEQYVKNGWDFPTREYSLKNNEGEIIKMGTGDDFDAMREKVYPFRNFMYSSAISLLKRKIPSQQIKENNQFKSEIYLSEKKGCRVNFIRIINCLSILGFFKDENGGDIAKQKVMEAFGALLNKDFSTFSNDLSSTKSASNKDGNSLTKIFDEMLNKQKEINGIDQ